MTQFRSNLRPAIVALIAGVLLAVGSPVARAQPDASATARSLLLHGRYDEARAAYQRLATQDPVAAAIGIARCRREVGETDAALATIAAALAKHPDADLFAERARLELERGDPGAARAQTDSALARDPDQLLARWLDAELDRRAGRLDEANEGYRWFVRYYNQHQDSLGGPEAFRWIGLGAAQYARWTRNSGQFHFLVNTLYPDALAQDSTYWPVHLEAALLFIEKYNQADAESELRAAFATNPNAAELHVARGRIALLRFDVDSARAEADRALARNARLVSALQLRADARMVGMEPREALPDLERALALDSANEETLGRLAAVFGAIDGVRDGPDTRMGRTTAQVVSRNPHAGGFYAALAGSLELLRQFPDAARYYEEARRLMPQLLVNGPLGLLAMRLGDEPKARVALKEAFEEDPFNVRVKNSLAVLELLEGYREIVTEHFVVRFDAAHDSLLARYASRHLEEEVYPEIVKALGYRPPDRSLFEIFGSAQGQSGHGWFSVRMVGVPFIGTVGACAGKMVALTSPNDGPKPFNWARVIRHEFVHVVNLQQTGFRIPHWYTEALAVRHEGPGHPREWDPILAKRVAEDRLFDLDHINLGFVRPESGEDWALAYYQASLYARYMAETYGDDAEAKMLAAYADRLDTRAALKRCFGVAQEAFEKGYRGFVRGVAGKAPSAAPAKVAEDAAALERAAAQNPRDALVLARLARAHFDAGRPYQAREWADKALAIDPRQAGAGYVSARIHLLEGHTAPAREALRITFDAEHPDAEALALLANLTVEAKDWAEARRLAELGAQRFPSSADWQGVLIAAYRETGQRDSLAAALAARVDGDADDFATRAELARLATDRGDFESAARWAIEAIHIDVLDPAVHATLARALVETRRPERAIEEYETAVALDPEKLDWRLALAKACAAANRKERARQTLDALMARDAKFPGARELLETLAR